jgi:hypothetical protein
LLLEDGAGQRGTREGRDTPGWVYGILALCIVKRFLKKLLLIFYLMTIFGAKFRCAQKEQGVFPRKAGSFPSFSRETCFRIRYAYKVTVYRSR